MAAWRLSEATELASRSGRRSGHGWIVSELSPPGRLAGVIRSARAVSSSVRHIDCTPPGYAGVVAPVAQARHNPLVSSRLAADAIRQLQPPDNESPTLISI